MRLIKLLKKRSMTGVANESDVTEPTVKRARTTRSEITRLFHRELKAEKATSTARGSGPGSVPEKSVSKEEAI